MITLPDIDTLALVGVFDRGVPNMERVVIRALRATEMAQYAVIVGWNPLGPGTPARPLNNLYFWFGDGLVHTNETIFLYTGQGEPRKTTLAGTSDTAYVVHWGMETTLFADTRFVPIIMAMGQILIANPPQNLPQVGRLSEQ